MHKDSLRLLRKEYCKEFKHMEKETRKALRWTVPFLVILLFVLFGMLIAVASDNFTISKFENLLQNNSIPIETRRELITIGKSFKYELHNINKDLRISLYHFALIILGIYLFTYHSSGITVCPLLRITIKSKKMLRLIVNSSKAERERTRIGRKYALIFTTLVALFIFANFGQNIDLEKANKYVPLVVILFAIPFFIASSKAPKIKDLFNEFKKSRIPIKHRRSYITFSFLHILAFAILFAGLCSLFIEWASKFFLFLNNVDINVDELVYNYEQKFRSVINLEEFPEIWRYIRDPNKPLIIPDGYIDEIISELKQLREIGYISIISLICILSLRVLLIPICLVEKIYKPIIYLLLSLFMTFIIYLLCSSIFTSSTFKLFDPIQILMVVFTFCLILVIDNIIKQALKV